MGKLLPPNIEGTIPAFYANSDGTVKITVPFSMNRAVSNRSITGFSLKIKTVQSSSYLHTWEATSWDAESAMEAVFDVPSELLRKLRIGQFYKIQLAYISGLTYAETIEVLQNKLDLYHHYKNAYTDVTQQTELRNAYNIYAASGSNNLSQIPIGELIIAIGSASGLTNESEWYQAVISQLRIDDKTVGYYSSVGVIKYTTRPVVQILNLEDKIINSHVYQYTGYYSQANGDRTEHLYSYRFDVYDKEGKLYKTTGDVLHNSNNDVNNYESYDSFMLQEDFDPSDVYSIRYSVTSISGLELTSPRYRIMQKISVNPEIDAKLVASIDYENGYVSLNLVGNINPNTGAETPVTGSFLISRASAATNFLQWDEISRFKLGAQTPSRFLQNDFTLEQGQTYQYSIQQYNDNGLYSNRIYSNKIYANFEDAFLFDGERQLRIRFNPKISTFKNDLLEAKIDTIGSKHPFIFRNGNVMYKEMSIAGLISYHMDENNLFLHDGDMLLEDDKWKERTQTTFRYDLTSAEDINTYALDYQLKYYSKNIVSEITDMYNVHNAEYTDIKNSNYRTTNLTSYNITAERIFKLAVLEWLNNGKPKLFRSPTEGNYIVRLLNVSLQPNDTLGRMLHSFTSTAYEIADYTYKNLDAYGLVTITSQKATYLRFETVDLAPVTENGTILWATGRLNRYPAMMFKFENLMPGAVFYIDGEPFQIGATGTYEIQTGKTMNIISIPDDARYTGQFTYGYYSSAQNQFDTIASAEVVDTPIRQFIGEHENIVNEITDYRSSLVKFLFVHARIRPLMKCYVRSEQSGAVYYQDWDCQYKLIPDPFYIYKVYQPYGQSEVFIRYYDGYNNKTWDSESTGYKPTLEINGSEISLAEVLTFDFDKPASIKSIKINNGVTVDCGYQVCTISYMIEQTNAEVVYAKQLWQTAYNNLQEAIDYYDDDSNVMNKDQENIRVQQLMITEQNAYQHFLKVLEEQKTIEDNAKGEIG